MSPLVAQYLLTGLSLIPQLVQAGSTVAAEVAALKSKVQAFQKENRDPTAEEWAAQNAALSDAIEGLTKP